MIRPSHGAAVKPLTDKRVNCLVIVLLVCYIFAGFGVDLITPSLPAITHALHTSATVGKSLIAFYMLGFACGNFCIGILSDAWGRRRLLLTGLGLFVLASITPLFFQVVPVFLGVRFLQGFGIGAFAVLLRAIFSDLLPKARLAAMATWIITMWGIGPIIAPVMGAYLQFYFDWQACFYFFAGAGFLVLMVFVLMVPETHHQRQTLCFAQIRENFARLLTHRVFLGSIFMMGLACSLVLVFNTLGPFLIQRELHYSPLFFGHLALMLGFVFLAGTIGCRRLIKKYPIRTLLPIIFPIALTVTLMGVIAALMMQDNVVVIALVSALMFIACGLILPMGMGEALSLFPEIAGSASALMNLVNLGTAALSSFIVSFFNVTHSLILMLAYFVLILLCGLAYMLSVKKE